MKTWETLLGSPGAKETHGPFGPRSAEIAAALRILGDLRWYTNVGKPSPLDESVVRVSDWDAAWDGTKASGAYAPEGTLLAPSALVAEARRGDDQLQAWWTAAREALLEVDMVDPPSLPGWGMQAEARAMDYVFRIGERLLDEILTSDQVECTYFREQFQWLAAGYFPCGWEGTWPRGKMRVF